MLLFNRTFNDINQTYTIFTLSIVKGFFQFFNSSFLINGDEKKNLILIINIIFNLNK